MKKLLISLCVLSTHLLHGVHPDQVKVGSKPPRITELLPNTTFCPPAIEPGIPENFVAMTREGKFTNDPYSSIYWGPKEVLEAFFKNHRSLNTAIICASVSDNVKQTGPDSFNGDTDKMIEEGKKLLGDGFTSIKKKWGPYPVVCLRTYFMGIQAFTVHVGTNDPSGCTYLFRLIYPMRKEGPSEEDLDLWLDFLANTKPLEDADYFKALGQDLQDGYTIVEFGKNTMGITAELRERDNALQIVSIPLGGDITFECEGVALACMGAKWRYGEPITRVMGVFDFTNGDQPKFTVPAVTSVFVESVSEFSVKKDELKTGCELYLFEFDGKDSWKLAS